MDSKQLSELKSELSKISGVNMHNPKFRKVFKKYIAAEVEDEVAEVKEDDVVADKEVVENAVAEVADEVKTRENPTDETVEAIADNVEEEAKEELAEVADETIDEVTEDSTETVTEVAEETPETETVASDTADSVEVPTEAESVPAIDLNGQLLETKLELELVRAGVREDRLEVAKRLFLPELQQGLSIEDLRIKISAFPEWLAKSGGAQGFGMPLGDNTSALTNEEKQLKKLGVSPRD